MGDYKPSYEELEKRIKELERVNVSVQDQSQNDIAGHFYQTILNMSFDAFVFLESDGTVIDANKAYESMTGYSRQELTGKHVGKFIHTDHAEDLVEFYAQIEKKGSANFESKNVHKNGVSIWVDVHAITVTMHDKKIILVNIRDINARKLAESELAKQQAFMKDIINSMPGILYIFDRDHNFLYWNRNFELATGCSAEELKSKKFTDFFLDKSLKIVHTGIEEVFSKDHAEREALLTSKKGNRTPYLFTGTKVTVQNREYIIGVGIDLVERKKLEAQLRQSHKMEAVGQLAGGVAHDFNNMLNVILGYTEVIMLDLPSEDPLYAKIEQIGKAATRSADLTKQLLGFSRNQVIEPKPICINELLVDIGQMISRLIGEDIDTDFHFGHNLWTVNLDPSQIDQLVMNLAINARDAMPDGGKLVVETNNETFDDTYCSEHPGFIRGEFVRISVSDDGTGMSKETLPHIFEPYYTTKELGKGTGLGLATVYGIIQQNNGFINVYSEPGEGTTFKLYIPRWAENTEKTEKLLEKSDISKIGTILLVEDDPLLLRLTGEFLEIGGHKVIPFSSSNDALQYCKRENTEIHLLLTDVIMPEINGKILSQRIKNIRPDIKTIFMSGYTANIVVHRGVLEEKMNFINKPFSMDKLLRMIQEVI